MRILLSFAVIVTASLLFAGCSPDNGPKPEKVRVIVTCDPELDDNNSLIRYLLFSTDFDTEGLIYASSRFHWKGDGKGTTQYIPGREYSSPGRDLGPQTKWRWAEGERFIDDIVEAYEKHDKKAAATRKRNTAKPVSEESFVITDLTSLGDN